MFTGAPILQAGFELRSGIISPTFLEGHGNKKVATSYLEALGSAIQAGMSAFFCCFGFLCKYSFLKFKISPAEVLW